MKLAPPSEPTLRLSTAEMMAAIQAMDPEAKKELDAFLLAGDAPIWVPQDGPQLMAYLSQADIVFYGGAAGGGKGLSLDTPLPTPVGWTTMGAVRPGDELLAPDGRPCVVTAATPVQHRACYRLTFDDGSQLVADDVHRWVTFDAAELQRLSKTPEWRARRRATRPSAAKGNKSAAFTAAIAARNAARVHTHRPPEGTMRDTAQLAATLRTSTGRANHAIKLTEPLALPPAELPVPPYTLGAWLGDGSSRNGQFTGEDDCILDRIRADGFEVRTYDWSDIAHNIIGLKVQLRAAGVLGAKHIPMAYLRASRDQRLALLQGLMDTDGHAAMDGGCEFDGINEKLVDGVLELALSLGIKATKLRGVATLDGRVIGPKWRVRFTTSMPVFGLERKAQRLKAQTRRTTAFRYLVACDPIESVPTRCIAVDSPSRQFLAGRAMVPTHNTDLLLGLCLTAQEHSIIFRREAVQLTGIEERMTSILGTRKGYNSQDGVWRLPGGKVMELGSVKEVSDWVKYQGRPHDFKGFDEITHFAELQFRTLIGWLRTDKPDIRQRVVAAGNPPTTAEGEWVKRYWAPWLDPQHHNPAKPGELRWYVSNEKGEDQEVPNGDPVMVGSDLVKPKSRTFIPSSVDDNLFLLSTGYKATLQSLPEPLRSQMLRGDFQAGAADPAWQTIPTEWVKAAMARWADKQAKGEMTALGFDPARGGVDKSSIAPRHGQWFDKIITAPGIVTKDGPTAAAFVIPHVRNGACICVDSIGIGSSALDFLTGLNLNVLAVNGSEASAAITKAGSLRYRNKRAEMYWRLREALDPTSPDPIALPPDQELLGDLTAVRYKVVTMGKAAAIQMRSKDEIREMLGRSPDKGDAVAMTFAVGVKPPNTRRDEYESPPPPDWRM